MTSTAKNRSYVFTANNYTPETETMLQGLECKYMIYGREVAPTTGTPHIQGYVSFKSPLSFNSVLRKLNGCNVEIAKGTADSNKTYCSKEDPDPFEKGDMPRAGARNDLEVVRQVLKETNSMACVADIATSYQSIKMAEVWLKYKEHKRDWKPNVIWYYGETGTGKTKRAHDEAALLGADGTDLYLKSNADKWFEGYDAHPAVLFDDLRPSTFPFHYLLQLLDRYSCRVECKGSTRQFLATTIYITCPTHPKYFAKDTEDVQQLLRRIDKIYHVKHNDPPITYDDENS